MIQYLACEIGQRGITILGVNPGTIMGDSIKLMLGESCSNKRGTSTLARIRCVLRETRQTLQSRSFGSARRWRDSPRIDDQRDGGSIFAMCGR